MTVYLLVGALIIFACVLLSRVSGKLGIPTLLAFILLGMLFGSDGIIKIPFEDYSFAEAICSVALIFIMFYGGFGTNWRAAKPVAVKSLLLSTLGVVITAALTGLFCRFALGIGWLESFLIGSVISSTDAASVFSILRSRRLGLKHNTASLLELESGSNDPFSYMLTVIFISALQGRSEAGEFALMLLRQVGYGVVFGAVFAVVASFLLKRISFSTPGFDAVFTVGVALLAYAAPAALGGNGYISAYIVGIVLGNSSIRNKRNLVHFFDGTTGLMQMLIFFLLGLLAFPSRMLPIAFDALLIAVFLTFVARPVSVLAILSPFGGPVKQSLLVSWSGLRGAASIVFAIMALTSVEAETDIFHTVFFIVLFSILIQGSLIPFFASKLGMTDDSADVMKTFNDYSEEVPVRFIQFTLPPGHKWVGMPLRDIILPPDTLAVLLERDGANIVPDGSTVLLDNDAIILSAGTPSRIDGIRLSEIRVGSDSDLIGKRVSSLTDAESSLVIMIQRRGTVVIPRGSTVLEQGDVLVLGNRSQV